MKVSEGPVKELGLVTIFIRFQFGGIIPLKVFAICYRKKVATQITYIKHIH